MPYLSMPQMSPLRQRLPPKIASEFIYTIPTYHPPLDADKAQQVRDLLLDLQHVISLHKFDVSTVDLVKHGYFRIDNGDVEPN